MDVPPPLVKAAGFAGRSRQPEQAHREVCSGQLPPSVVFEARSIQEYSDWFC